jgi:hypothetical protein
MLPRPQMKKLIIGAAFATLLAPPAFAQSYSASYGTGNVVNLSLAGQTNGAAGIGATAYSGGSAKSVSGLTAYAYVPRPDKAFTAAERGLFARQGLSAAPWSVP